MDDQQQRTLDDLLGALTGKLRKPRDWTPLLQLASDTLTVGTLAFNVLGSPLEPELPEEIRALMAEVLSRATSRNERLLGQLFEVLPALNAAGVEPIAMRGIASVLEGGPHIGRLMSDIDLLVPRTARDVASEILIARGYQVLQGFHGPPFPITLGRSTDVGTIDLHTHVQPFFLEVDYGRLVSLCRRVQFDAGVALLPDPTCALVLYVLHDQLHDGDYWRGLIDARHFADIPRLVQAGIDWQTLQGFFPKGCARNALDVQLRSAKSILKIDIPEHYCGGMLARIQLGRRHLQLRFPRLMPLLTFLSVAADRPAGWLPSGQGKRLASRGLWARSSRAFRRANPGKLVFRSN